MRRDNSALAPLGEARRDDEVVRAVIIGNGPLRRTQALRNLLRLAGLVICADGGLRTARALRVAPHIVVGDLDSASAAAVTWARRRGARFITHPREKDKTDTELAVEHALAAGADELDLVGVLGGRFDHALANVGLLIQIAAQHKRARILHGAVELFLADTKTPIAGRRGDLVSLLPLSDTVDGITTQGLKYPLHDGVLRMSTSRGVSNEVVLPPAAVTVKSGWLLIVVSHRP